MKRILGLDLGTTSIGWALVGEAKDEKEKSSIIRTGVRIIQYDTFNKVDKSGKVSESKNVQDDFSSGKGLSPNAKRTQQRGARRNLQRYKYRRELLFEILKNNQLISDDTVIAEEGENSTHALWELRAKAATEKINLKDFVCILFALNKKRGYKSNRKAKDEGDGQAIDGMEVAKILTDKNITPGQYVLDLLSNDKKHIPDFYRSDLQTEFDKIWEFQKQFYTSILTDELKENLTGKSKTVSWAVCKEPFNIVGEKRITKGAKLKEENYKWRVNGLTIELTLEQLAIVLQEINGQISNSSGYLGAISDRAKKLNFNKQTVGQYLYKQIKENPHTRLKNQVFYRQDYLDEYNQIWKTQAKFHSELTDELKKEIEEKADIFYQRRLKSQKGLISICELEGREIELKDKDGKPVLNGKGEPKRKIIGPRVIPKSSPLFQEFKIWSILNNLEFRNVNTKEKEKIKSFDEDLEIRKNLFTELNTNGKLSNGQILKLVFKNPKEWELNYKDGLEGNNTNQILFKAYQSILDLAGYEGIDAVDIEKTSEIFDSLGINKKILYFDAELAGKAFEQQASYQLWHLIYSYEGDDSVSGNEKLFYHLKEKFGIEKEFADTLVNTTFKDHYGSLSTKAIRKILPYLKQGNDYYEACGFAKYNHSHSVTKEEKKDALELLPKNSLRNPVVEKILNQMVNVINAIIEEYGKPDEIRIELARELKKTAKEREDATKGIAAATKKHDEIREKLKEFYPFNTGIRITKKDIIKYKLWEELASNGHKTIYTDTYVDLGKLFTKEFDVEHIIPKAVLFDDSFSNKTLSVREFNRWKSSKTGIDAIIEKYQEDSEGYNRYVSAIEKLHEEYQKTKNSSNPRGISKAKYNKLLMKGSEIPDGFIERDLRNTQYIAKKAKSMLLEVFRTVVPITGSVTAKLREDWQLINVMKDLNWDKYDKLGLTEYETNKDGDQIRVIKDWTKRNDHRHHAMDALTVAFTKHNHIQYYNFLNARKDEKHKEHAKIVKIENSIIETVEDKKGAKNKLMKAPMPLNKFRAEAKKHLENTFISFKTKNKVVTRNKNRIKGKEKPQDTLTPRGQLHKETVYGKSKRPLKKPLKLNKKFSTENAESIIDAKIRSAVLSHLKKFDDKSEIAFDTKTLKKHPLLINGTPLKEVKCFEEIYTIRKEISSDNFKDLKSLEKVIDGAARKALQKRLAKFDGDAKKAFSNLEENPIWLNEEKGIQLKRVTITGVSNAEPLHHKKDQFGKKILDNEGKPIAVDYVSTGNNHHVAIYRDEEGNLQEEVVSFYEAVIRKNQKLPVIFKSHPKNPNWEFLFTLKQNEMFVFPNKGTAFDPTEIDLLDENNYHLISPNLFRVQKIQSKEYVFRHHLETVVQRRTSKGEKVNETSLRDLIWKRYKSMGAFKSNFPVKVRINHLGQIVKIGE